MYIYIVMSHTNVGGHAVQWLGAFTCYDQKHALQYQKFKVQPSSANLFHAANLLCVCLLAGLLAVDSLTFCLDRLACLG